MFFLLLKSKKKNKKKRKSDKLQRLPNSRKIKLSLLHRERLGKLDDLKISDRRRKRNNLLRVDGSRDWISSKSLETKKGVVFNRTFFTQPAKSPVCIRRDFRRKFLFASGLAGKIKVKNARWNEFSKVICK